MVEYTEFEEYLPDWMFHREKRKSNNSRMTAGGNAGIITVFFRAAFIRGSWLRRIGKVTISAVMSSTGSGMSRIKNSRKMLTVLRPINVISKVG